jgi:hypothetical protein
MQPSPPGSYLNRSHGLHVVLSLVATDPGGHTLQYPPVPAEPSAHGNSPDPSAVGWNPSRAGKQRIPSEKNLAGQGTHAVPFRLAVPASQGAQAVRPTLGDWPAGHTVVHCPATPPDPRGHSTHSHLDSLGINPSAQAVQLEPPELTWPAGQASHVPPAKAPSMPHRSSPTTANPHSQLKTHSSPVRPLQTVRELAGVTLSVHCSGRQAPPTNAPLAVHKCEPDGVKPRWQLKMHSSPVCPVHVVGECSID